MEKKNKTSGTERCENTDTLCINNKYTSICVCLYMNNLLQILGSREDKTILLYYIYNEQIYDILYCIRTDSQINADRSNKHFERKLEFQPIQDHSLMTKTIKMLRKENSSQTQENHELFYILHLQNTIFKWSPLPNGAQPS